MSRTWLLERLREHGAKKALAGHGWTATYRELLEQMQHWLGVLDKELIEPGRIVAFDGDFGPPTVSLLLALIERACIAVPLASAAPAQKPEFLATVSAEHFMDATGAESTSRLTGGARHALVDKLAGE